ncbi:hypothetical protein H8959_019979 [Pygathrix nigripes]
MEDHRWLVVPRLRSVLQLDQIRKSKAALVYHMPVNRGACDLQRSWRRRGHPGTASCLGSGEEGIAAPATSRSSEDRSLPTNPQQRYSGSPGRDKVPFPVHWGDNWPRLPPAPLPAVPQLRDRGQSAPFRAGIGAAAAPTALHARAAEEGGASSQLLTPEAPPRWLGAREEGPDSGGRNGGSGPPVQAAPGNACFAVPQRVVLWRRFPARPGAVQAPDDPPTLCREGPAARFVRKRLGLKVVAKKSPVAQPGRTGPVLAAVLSESSLTITAAQAHFQTRRANVNLAFSICFRSCSSCRAICQEPPPLQLPPPPGEEQQQQRRPRARGGNKPSHTGVQRAGKPSLRSLTGGTHAMC